MGRHIVIYQNAGPRVGVLLVRDDIRPRSHFHRGFGLTLAGFYPYKKPFGRRDIATKNMMAQRRPSITMTKRATGEAINEAREKYRTYVSIERPLSEGRGWALEESESGAGAVEVEVGGASSRGIFESAAARACRR